MNKKLLSAIAGCLFISFFGCDFGSSSSTSKELNPDAGDLKDHSALGDSPVTDSNKDIVASLIMNSIQMPSTNRKLRSSIRPDFDTTFSIDSTINNTYNVDGESSGYAQIKENGSFIMNYSSQSQYVKINYTISTIYYDFSNDNKIFIGGEGQGTVTANSTSDDNYSMSVKLDGYIQFSGLYIGECKYNMSAVLNENEFTYSGSMTIISDGKEYTFNIDENNIVDESR